MAMMEISVIPLGTGKTSVSPYIAEIFKYLRKQKGLRYELNGMGTIVTGKSDQLLNLAATLHKIPSLRAPNGSIPSSSSMSARTRTSGPSIKWLLYSGNFNHRVHRDHRVKT